MPNTITTFYTFSPNTKARSSEVNTNFNNYRGSLLPINTNTQTASNLTHDLGASDHFWKTTYTNDIYVGQNTSDWRFFLETSTGNLLFANSSTTLGVFPAGGIPGISPKRTEAYTTSAAIGGKAQNSLFNTTGSARLQLSSSVGYISGSTVTIETTGRPVLYKMSDWNNSTTGRFISFSTFSSGDIVTISLFVNSGSGITQCGSVETLENRVSLSKHINFVVDLSAGSHTLFLGAVGLTNYYVGNDAALSDYPIVRSFEL